MLATTVVAAMPESASFDRIDINADARMRATRISVVHPAIKEAKRALTAEVSGFAINDLDVADFVGTLDRREPFCGGQPGLQPPEGRERRSPRASSG